MDELRTARSEPAAVQRFSDSRSLFPRSALLTQPAINDFLVKTPVTPNGPRQLVYQPWSLIPRVTVNTMGVTCQTAFEQRESTRRPRFAYASLR